MQQNIIPENYCTYSSMLNNAIMWCDVPTNFTKTVVWYGNSNWRNLIIPFKWLLLYLLHICFLCVGSSSKSLVAD